MINRKNLMLVILVVASMAVLSGFGLYQHKEQAKLRRSLVVTESSRKISYGPVADPFASPIAIFVKDDYGVYVADSNNHRLRIFDQGWNLVKNIGKLGAEKGQFRYPVGIGVNSTGEIFASEIGNKRIQVFDTNGQFLRTFPANSSEVLSPSALTVDNNDRVLVFDRGDQLVKSFDRDGKLLLKFGGKGRETGQFNYVMGIAVFPNGNIAVSDSGNMRVQIFDGKGKFLEEVFEGVNGLPLFGLPRGISVVDNNSFVVADALARQVLKVSRVKQRWNSRVIAEDFVVPDGLCYFNGRIYVADRGDNSVMLIDNVR